MSAHVIDTTRPEGQPGEEWRPVVGWEPYYEVSSYGRVRSLPRTITRRDGVVQRRPGRERQLHIGHCGYQELTLSLDASSVTVRVHVLVAAAFIGPRPEGHVVRHLDGNPANNAVTNLAYGTPMENTYDALDYESDAPVARTECIYGHHFAGANLKLRTNPRSIHGRERVCVACSRARDWAKDEKRAGRPVTKQQRIDRAHLIYAELTGRAVA